MMFLLDTSQDLAKCAAELQSPAVGQLLSPLTRYTNRSQWSWAMDNGCFSAWDRKAWSALLARELPNREGCLFVTVPDVVASARRTLELWRYWRDKSELDGWPLALVMQDGMEDFDIPWRELDAVFIGGSTSWKCGPHAEAICRCARIMGKWVHMGRVNTAIRLDMAERWGVLSVDGTGLSRYTHMRQAVASGVPAQAVLDI